MQNAAELFGLNDEQMLAVKRFHAYHRPAESKANANNDTPEHAMHWSIDDGTSEVTLVCNCGATLHIDEQVYVTVEPQRFLWGDEALKKRIAAEMIDAVTDPHARPVLYGTPAGVFSYLYGISKAYELANRDVFPVGLPRELMRLFVREACGEGRDLGFEGAIEACGSDERAFEILRGLLTEAIEELAPETELIDLADEKQERMKWLRETGRGIASESLFQSALVTLPDETFEQVRLHPSRTDMHFGLGLYLRNKFVHSGLLWCGVDPDSQSGSALDKLIRYCLPEFKDFDLIYSQLGHGVLYDAYRYCMEVGGRLPEDELKRNYDMLLDAQQIDDANPYSILDHDHYGEYRKWADRAHEKRHAYDQATLNDIWDFDTLSEDLDGTVIEECRDICISASQSDESAFIPSEIAYVIAGTADETALRAFDWVVGNWKAAAFLPAMLFERRDLALRALRQRGGLLERAMKFQDDDEIVLAAVASSPNAIKYASERLQHDRRVLATAAANAKSDLVFFEGPMAAYNDDDELVKLAIEANGMNIAFASERVRGDLDYAKLAWENVHSHTHYGMYDYLSDELKRNLELALVVARNCGSPPSRFPVIELADSDELGEALAERGDHWFLSGMSRRIKEKYMDGDELERWGDNPSWWDEEE